MNKKVLALSAGIALLVFLVAPPVLMMGLFLITAYFGLTYGIYRLIMGWRSAP